MSLYSLNRVSKSTGIRILLVCGFVILAANVYWYRGLLSNSRLGMVFEGEGSHSDSSTSGQCSGSAISAESDSAEDYHDAELKSLPIKYNNIAIASSFGFHHDVYMALAWTMEKILLGGQTPTGSIQVYASTPFAFGFSEIVDKLGLYHGTYKDPSSDLIQDMAQGLDGTLIDLLVFGTCEVDLSSERSEKLLEIWDARGVEQKFQLVCIVHNIADTGWQARITDWASRKAIRILPISEHVQRAFQKRFSELADSADPMISAAAYEDIPVDVHVPILDIPDLTERASDDRLLSKAVIQGTFDVNRRDYIRVFSRLKETITQEPQLWGYMPSPDSNGVYIVDPLSAHPPFELHLMGSGALEIPIELQNVVKIHRDLNYTEFYDLMSGMDLCIPAFSDFGYYEQQASSTFVMAVECDVPILVTKRMRRAYTYADDDRAVVTRPASLGEIAAIRELRDTQVAPPSDADKTAPFSGRSWRRQKREFDEVKRGIWRKNEMVVERLIRGL